jgi:peptidylprolyl isomerase
VRRVLPALLALALVAGCSSSDTTDDASPTSGESTGDAGVTVSDDTGAAPEITVPGDEPPTDLVSDVVVDGDGDAVVAGDLLVVDYAGVLWDDGEEFDSSWSRGTPAAFGIGVGAVIPGWDSGLVGKNVGDRVLLVIPPELGYGEQGSPGGVPGGATLVFAVDIRNSFGGDVDLGGSEVDDLPDGFPVVEGQPGQPPTIDVSGAVEPEESTSVVVVEGDGEVVEGDTVVVHAVQAPLSSGEVTFSTWDAAPESLPRDGLPGLADALEGATVGTRVVSLVPADDNGGEALVLVLDVLGAF